LLGLDIQKSSVIAVEVKEKGHTLWASDERTFQFATLFLNVVAGVEVIQPSIARP
jgi:hypothetical protein